ncbi:MAG: UPF0182 family protein, partial [Armatimonadetes bacterium]|nr:UPF0182 family protein [Armatimonadota bacterium]
MTRTVRRLILAILFLLLFGGPMLARWYTDWLWFGELGYLRVFWVPLISRATIGFGAAALVFLVLFLNLLPLANLWSRGRVIRMDRITRRGSPVYEMVRRGRPARAAGIIAGVVAVIAGLAATDRWVVLQQFLHTVAVGRTDPVFGRDLGFYLFQLPLYRMVNSWLFTWLFIAVLAAIVGYYLDAASLLLRGGRALLGAISPAARTHLSLMLGLLMVVWGTGFWLDTFQVLYSPSGAIYGPGYTDIHADLPALRFLMWVCWIGAVVLFANARIRTAWLGVAVIAVVLLVRVVGLALYPAFVQVFRVRPSELTVETPYIRQGVQATLEAFGLAQVKEVDYPAREVLTAEVLRRNQDTLDNVRLWDYRPLLRAYNQLQSLRPYYVFEDVDIDRYRIGGTVRQVMLAARELEVARLPAGARNWVNEHLVFTHGYGLVMSPINEISEEGMPFFLVKDIPPVSAAGLEVRRPQIYYGERTNQYVIVNTRVQEFDYPQGSDNAYTTYQGRGGIFVGGAWRRGMFAYRFGSLNLLLSADITPQSRVLMYRNIQQRMRRIAPFLRYDRDPYLVLADGRLFWIIDAYTTSDRYPYSTPTERVNYIRNAVKVVVDAYDGTADFYLVDPAEPVARVYAVIFPELFKPAAAMPEALREHLRYPVDLFEIQARVYATFHMRDPRVFYNREDLWAISNELFGDRTIPMEPYYVTMRLAAGGTPVPSAGGPGAASTRPEFILIQPFTPARRDNMVAWMAARNDAPNYGELLIYRFPKDRVIYGPMQIEARINQDPQISSQLTLWNQQGSQVIRGNLLVIPIEDSILYVEPLYLQAERSQLPELKRVMVVHGPRIAMDDTLEGALRRLFEGRTPSPAVQRPAPGTPPSAPGATSGPPTPGAAPPAAPGPAPPAAGPDQDLIVQAADAYRRAQERLRASDLAGYAREMEQVGRILE